MVEQTGGRATPPELQNEVKPKPEDALFFDMFFEMYMPEQSFYIVLDAYCRVWDIAFTGEDITLLQILWRERAQWDSKRNKEKASKSSESSKSGNPPVKSRRAKRK